MKAIGSAVALAMLAVGVTACSVSDGYYAPRSQATYYPARTTVYSTPVYSAPVYSAPVATYYSYPAATYYAYDAPSYQKSNVYSSRWDYYRNYKGIHDGPERTGP